MGREEETKTHVFPLCDVSQLSKGRAFPSFIIKTGMRLKVQKDREKYQVRCDAGRTDIHLDCLEQTRTYGYFVYMKPMVSHRPRPESPLGA